jgi:hypothetical protein
MGGDFQHAGDNVREFYSSLPRPVRVGIEATGSRQWFLNLMKELGTEWLFLFFLHVLMELVDLFLNFVLVLRLRIQI